MRKNNLPTSGFLIPRIALACFLFLTAGFLAFYSFAAAPSSGTLTETSGPLTYTSGPFLVSNPTATAELDCVTLPCDDFGLTVNVPAAFENTHNIVISVAWPNPAEDYDIYLRQGAPPGTAGLKDAASSSNPEVIVADAKPGAYTIRTVPFAVAGGSTTTTVELRLKPSSPPPVTPGPDTPRYHNFAAPPMLGNSAGEPTLAAGKPIAGQPGGRTMFIAGLETLRVTWNDCSSPASAPGFPADPVQSAPLWEDKSFATTSITSLDPILFGDLETGRVQVSQLGPKTSFLAYTDDDGETYTPTQGSPVNPGVDHQTIGGGPYSPNLEPPHPSHPNALYYASQDIAVAQLGRSDTGGLSYGPAVPMYNLTQCGGLHGHVKVTPRSPLSEANGHVGTVYVPNKGCAGQQAVVVSEDNGTTFAIRQVPGSVAGPSDPSVGIDKAGKIYVAMADGTGAAKVSVSADKGVTWQSASPIDVGAPFGIKNTVFPTAVGGDSGRATVMFLATDTGGDYEATDVFTGIWHIYAAHTFDGGLTWTTVRVTPENDPVQRGSICTGGTTCGGDRNLLDFNDMEIDQEGRVIMAYADGCVGCTSPTGADSRSDKATIARQSGGKRMLAAFDPPAGPLVPAAPLVTSVAKDGSIVSVDWEEPDNGGAPITGYNVFRREVGGTYPVAPLAAVGAGKTDYADPTTVEGTSYEYKVTATNSVGQGGNCGDFLVGVAIDPGNVCILPGLQKLGPDPGTGGTAPGAAGPGMDLMSMQLAQPFVPNGTPADILLVFRVNTDPGVSPQPVGSAFFVSMMVPDGSVRGVRMAFKGASPTQPTFESYTANPANGGQVDGRFVDAATLMPIESTSSYDAPNGIITLVVKASQLGLAPGDLINGFNAAVTQTSDPLVVGAGATATIDEMPNGLARTGTYIVQANDLCGAPLNGLPIAALDTDAATPRSGDAPLTVGFDAGGSSDPDGDNIVSYTFNFGDGSAEVTCPGNARCTSNDTVSHIYRDAGNFVATVRVQDDNNATSTNNAQVVVEVGLPLQSIVSRMTHDTAGVFDINLLVDGSIATEPRRAGGSGAPGSFTIVYTFDRSVTAPGTATTDDANTTPTVQSGPNANQVTVNLANVPNERRLRVTLNGVQDSAGANLTNVSGDVGILLADVNGDGRVDAGDVMLIRQQNLQTAAAGNFRTDVNASGRIDAGDVLVARQQNLTSLPRNEQNREAARKKGSKPRG